MKECLAFPMPYQNAMSWTSVDVNQHATVDPDVPLTEALQLRGHDKLPRKQK
jgi:hypothetical protein